MILLSLAIASLVVVVTLTLLMLRRRFIVVTVSGASMAPALVPGDRVLVRRSVTHGLGVGLVVVFGPPGEECQGWDSDVALPPIPWAIKRIVALPGDAVPDVARPAVGYVSVVPPDMLVVLGDSVGSVDSRTWGFLPAANILGVVVRRLGAAGTGPRAGTGRAGAGPRAGAVQSARADMS
jgi:signal peptidase I